MNPKTAALIESLKNAPLLAEDIPMATVFDRSLFGDIDEDCVLNFDQKLGHLYEQALESLIDSSPALSRLASNLQIFDDNKRTIGEMDYVLFDRENEIHIHLELAVKFYLARRAPEGWIYPGPNATDNWHRKLKHMRARQLVLAQTEPARKFLSEQFDIKDIQAQYLIYGCLFIPFDCIDPPQPQSMSAQRQQGRWLYVHQWPAQFANVKDVRIIPKALWPVEISSLMMDMFEKTSTAALLEQAKTNCVMFVEEGGDGQKWFLVPDDWG